MIKNKKMLIAVVIYAVLILSLIAFFNKLRVKEYEYTYNFSDFSVDAGCIDEAGNLFINEASAYSGVFSATRGTQLRSGDFTLTVRYHSAGTNVLHYAANSNCEKYIDLPENLSEITEHFSVWPASDNFRIWLIYKGSGDLSIESITLSSTKPLFIDYDYFMILTAVLGLLIPVIIGILVRKRVFGCEQWIAAGVMAVLSVVVSFPVFYDHIWMGVDTRPHLMRIDGVATAITARRFPTIIYDNYCNNYGEISCIYPDKFLYLPGLLRKCGVSLIASQGTALYLINTAALVVMYLCARYFTHSVKASLFAAVLYCFVPYRIYVMYGGGQAFGMGIAMLFFAPLFTALYDVFLAEGKRWYLLSFAMAGFIWSHVLSMALAVIMCFITAAFCIIVLIVQGRIKENIKRLIVTLCKSVALFLIFGLSTLVPFVYYHSKGLNLSTMRLPFLSSLYPLYDDYLRENGQYHILLFLVCIFVFVICIRAKRKTDIYCRFLLAGGFILFVMSTKLFPWKLFYNSIPFVAAKLDMFQFAERFRLAGTAAMCLGFGILYKDVEAVLKRKAHYAAVIIMLICVYIGCRTAYIQISLCDTCVFDRMTGDIYYKQIGYLPTGSEVSYYESNVPNCGDWDSVENISYIKNGTSIHYEYRCSSDGNYMEFPLFKYAGYHAYDAGGNELEIINSDHNRILINLVKGNDPQVIDIVFRVHPLFTVCAVISLLTVILSCFFIIRSMARESLTSISSDHEYNLHR